MYAVFPRSDYYGSSAPRPRHRQTWWLAVLRVLGARVEVLMFRGVTLGTVGGQLYPWQDGPHVDSGLDGGAPNGGAPSRYGYATRLCLRTNLSFHTEVSVADFNAHGSPWTVSPWYLW